jgi:O-antigen/teichoic acid export membrane protein/2-polyprenyl-3-methyl-5-hydroxy-6-metoxy-1,4-benzoquinol methylase
MTLPHDADHPVASNGPALSVEERVRLIRDGVVNCSALIFSGVVGIVLVPIMLRGLGAEAYGLWIVAITVSGMAGALDFGLGWSVTREVAASLGGGSSEQTAQFTRAAGITYLGLGLLGALVIGGLGQPLSNALKLSSETQRSAPLVFVLVGISHFAERILSFEVDVLHGLRRFGVLNLGSIAAVVLRAVGIITLLAVGAGLPSIAAWLALASALTTSAAVGIVSRIEPRYSLRLGGFDWAALREHILFGFASHLARKIGDIIWQIPAMAIGLFRGSAAIVPYYIGQRFPQAVSAINWSVGEVFFPAASEHARSQDMDRSREVLEVGTRWSLATALPLCVVLWIIAPNLLRAWLGAATPDAVLVLRLTAAAALAEAFGVSGLHVLWGRGAARTVLGILVAMALGTLGLSLWLLTRIGVAEAAWGVLVPMTLGAVIILRSASHACRIQMNDLIRGTFAGLLLPVVACLGVTAGTLRLIHPSGWIGVVGVALAGGVAFVVGLYFAPVSGGRREERMFIREVVTLPGSVGRSVWRALRRSLRRVGFLRSTYYLMLALQEAWRDTPASGRAELDSTFAQRRDPWDFETNELRGRKRYVWEAQMLDAVRGKTRFPQALEVGCAEGAFTEVLEGRCESLLAVDISPVALARARERQPWADHVRFDQWDLRSLQNGPLPGSFDLIVVVHALNYIRRPSYLRAVRARLVEGLRPGGYLLVANEAFDTVAQTSWWSKYLIRGGKWINAFIAEHPALEVIDTATLDLGDCLSLEMLCRKVR